MTATPEVDLLVGPKDADGQEVHIYGARYSDEETAQREGNRARSALRVAGARVGLAFDLGNRRAGGVSRSIRDELEAAHDVRVLDRVHGLVVFETPDRRVLESSAHARGVIAHRSDDVLSAVQDCWAGVGERLDPDSETAIDLVFLAAFETSPRAQFLALVTALEVLSGDPVERPTNALELIMKCEESVSSALSSVTDTAARDDLGSLLRYLEHGHAQSIGKTIRDHVRTVVPDIERFAGERPASFANTCYALRSSVIHDGTTTIPDLSELKRLVVMLIEARTSARPDGDE